MALLHRKRIFALGGAILALSMAPAVALAAGGKGTPVKSTTVTVRIEGLGRTLLAPTQVQARSGGWITKGGTPTGKCSTATAAGALDVATHHRWNGKWYASVPGIFVSSILGAAPTGNDYWTIFVNNVSSSEGLCSLKLHRGEQLLFAVTDGSQTPLVLSAPSSTTAGKAFKVTVDDVTANGKRKPVAGAHLTGTGVNATTNSHGIASITPAKAGTLVIKASHAGEIRSAPVSVSVTG